jgi:hypothetical protein
MSTRSDQYRALQEARGGQGFIVRMGSKKQYPIRFGKRNRHSENSDPLSLFSFNSANDDFVIGHLDQPELSPEIRFAKP